MTFEEFAAARLSGVLRFAGVLTADRALAEDVVQEVLVRVHARLRMHGGGHIGVVGRTAFRCPGCVS